jgi:4-hydroxy-tetrahydrodipicolinate reductase
MTEKSLIPVVVNGAAGKMGKEVIKAVAKAEDMILVGAVDRRCRRNCRLWSFRSSNS